MMAISIALHEKPASLGFRHDFVYVGPALCQKMGKVRRDHASLHDLLVRIAESAPSFENL